MTNEISRITKKDMVLGGYHIPANVRYLHTCLCWGRGADTCTPVFGVGGGREIPAHMSLLEEVGGRYLHTYLCWGRRGERQGEIPALLSLWGEGRGRGSSCTPVFTGGGGGDTCTPCLCGGKGDACTPVLMKGGGGWGGGRRGGAVENSMNSRTPNIFDDAAGYKPCRPFNLLSLSEMFVVCSFTTLCHL